MSTINFVRPEEKELAPVVHGESVQLKPPPLTPRPVPTGFLSKIAPLLIIVGVIGIMVMIFKARSAATGGWGMAMFPMFLISGVIMMFMNKGGRGTKKNETAKDTIDYLRYLDVNRDISIENAAKQYKAAQFHYPPAQALAWWIKRKSTRLWERRMGSPEFAHARVGLGDVDAVRHLDDVELGALEDQEPASTDAVQALLAEHNRVRDIPRPLALASFPAVSYTGDLQVGRDNARAMLAHLAFFHGYDDMEIAAIVDDKQAKHWDWLKWLPHHQQGVRQRYMTYASAYDLVEDLDASFTDRGYWSGRTMRVANIQSQAGETISAPSPVSGRHLIVICDSASLDWSTLLADGDKGRAGVTFLDIGGECTLTSTDSTLLFRDGAVWRSETIGGRPEYMAIPDRLGITEAETFARRLAPFRVGSAGSRIMEAAEDTSSSIDLMDLLNIDDAGNFDPAVTWQWSQDHRNFLRVPVGRYIDSGRTWYIDFKEDDESHGPHTGTGGSTGAGKSEKLRTETLSLCVTHSPEDVVITPCDFKGNKTFRGLERLPHVPMVLHNLSSSRDRIARVLQVFMGEIERRYELLDLIGEDGTKIDEYNAIRRARPELKLPPMPHWFIPFDELMQAKREFPELLAIMRIVGTVGRSVGVHEEPVSQTLDDSLMTGISTHLRGRTAMKMNDPKDYKPILGTSNVGAALPRRKGVGYFVEDFNGLPQRVESCYVSKTYEPPVPRDESQEEEVEIDYYRPRMLSAIPDPVARSIEGGYDDEVPKAIGALADLAAEPESQGGGTAVASAAGALAAAADASMASGEPAAAVEMGSVERRTVMSTVIDVLERYCIENDIELPHQLWLPELDTYTALSTYAADYVAELQDPKYPPALVSPCGIIDKPRDHRQDILEVDLSKNAAIAGGEESGKSLAMASIIMGAAYVYGPERMQFYCIDQGGGRLGALRDLDHVGDVVTGVDSYGVQRIINHFNHVIKTRTAQWKAAGIDTVEEWRRLKFDPQPGDKPIPEDPNGDMYLFIDGFDQTIEDYKEHVDSLLFLASSGPGVGVHLVVSVRSWNSRGTHKFWDKIKAMYELRLGTTNDSNMGRAVADTVPPFPGRGVISVSGGREARRDVMPAGADSIPRPIAWHILFAEPAVMTAGGEKLTGSDACKFLNARHSSVAAPGIPVLPKHVPFGDVPEGPPGTVRLGLRESDLGPQYWVPERDGHLYIIGEGGSGKTELAKLVCRHLQKEIEDSSPEERPIVVVVDSRRGLAGAVPDADSYVYMGDQIGEAIDLVLNEMRGRNPDVRLTQAEVAAQVESGRGFEGRRVFMVVENFQDWVENSSSDPFRVLQKLADRGKDVGFHMVITRVADSGAWSASGGVLASMRSTSSPALALSADPSITNLIGKVKGQKFDPGRGLLVSREGHMMVQIAEDPGKL
ncbi:FtsK/SpoIIIE domain-containing protein [Mycobacteroides abscessus]|uniref:FtsK/SpoIIIE domain-containing protein n=1 Tax=Mycobacteroides abscessus TaxID=36809 RepID=UPI0009A58DDB|nr:FtsK/SpoIIIE domain-containing protein [Mycobacteroides abscessus]SKH87287.1 Putative FtsK/SpoIIIE family protein [Mycobacteroides abscessus subsp. massiliense]SKH91706.1 Putative FtsK/SpoIIIE family protein [Mycobacteroides abscessus subsp. massiliense]SKI12429.1 Putative FtsK/SpoIIIE family protein [Mycobacteroides abscessus subsp. massiliense]SKK22874.1 Putative FtsK/SpoIIIE family protein [Mycobacteroides abscessus subsp. massiliense]SKK30371.1 Putative FtsK/SpoIIIE family protein [Myco